MRKGKNNPQYFEDQLLFDWINGVNGVQIQNVIERLNKGEKWGMKHPNIATRWEEIQSHVSNPHFIVTHRKDFQAQTKSHRNAINRQSPESLKARHNAYYQTVDRITVGHPRLDVYFEDWFERSGKQLQSLAEFAGLTVTRSAQGLIDPKLKHY